jgi:hypothetical protein
MTIALRLMHNVNPEPIYLDLDVDATDYCQCE